MKPMVKIDDREFRRALRKYKEATRKDVPAILNHAATQAAFKATSPRYVKDARKGAWPLSASANPERRRRKWKYRDRFFFALAQKSGTPGRNSARRIYRRRRSSVGYVRANFGSIINKLGLKRGRIRAAKEKISVKKARAGREEVEVKNQVLDGPAALKAHAIINRGWKRAVHDAVFGRGGMKDFAETRLAKRLKRR